MPARLTERVTELLEVLAQRQWTLAVAETDTGGRLLEALTARGGSSAVVLGGVVAYHDRLKERLLGVPSETLATHGAVSRPVAEALAVSVRDLAGADLGLASTGIAGPGGATLTKPVGLTWVAVAHPGGVTAREHRWTGDRAANRFASGLATVELGLSVVRAA